MNESVGLSIVGVQPHVHQQYRQAFFEKEDTLNGVYARELPLDLALLNEVLEGRIVLEGDSDLGGYGGAPVHHTHQDDHVEVPVYRKDSRRDLTRLNIRNLPRSVCYSIRKYFLDKHNTYYGHMGRFVSMAMELGLKMRKGTVKIARESRDYAEGIITTCGDAPLLKMVHNIGSKLSELTKHVINPETPNKKKKQNKNQHRVNNKLTKAIRALDEVKKLKKASFSSRDYSKALVGLFGQGDERTVKTDLQLLKDAGYVSEDRMQGLHGVMRYCFKENAVYDDVRGSEARKFVLQKLKQEFKGRKQVIKSEVMDWVRSASGLNDSKFCLEIFEGLFTLGWLIQSGPSGNIFDVHLD